MKLPGGTQAYIEDAKLKEYLLNTAHPVGGAKARYFHSLGFADSHIDVLRAELLRVARETEVASVSETIHGKKYVIDGEIVPPAGRRVRIQTVWIVDAGQIPPRLITAYPG